MDTEATPPQERYEHVVSVYRRHCNAVRQDLESDLSMVPDTEPRRERRELRLLLERTMSEIERLHREHSNTYDEVGRYFGLFRRPDEGKLEELERLHQGLSAEAQALALPLLNLYRELAGRQSPGLPMYCGMVRMLHPAAYTAF